MCSTETNTLCLFNCEIFRRGNIIYDEKLARILKNCTILFDLLIEKALFWLSENVFNANKQV